MKQIKYFEVDPGGNVTAIVPGVFADQKRKTIARRILDNNPLIEQVGFWMKARSKESHARLEMAGGEFCGNATRSLAALLERRGRYLLEVSGMTQPIAVRASKKNAEFIMPLKMFSLRNNICTLPGITHLLTPGKIFRGEARIILRNSGLLQEKASGVIGYGKLNKNTYEIFPIVRVRDIDTLFAETACASGTAAIAYFLSRSKGAISLKVKQPSGAIFSTEIRKGNLVISGPIQGINERILNF